MVNGLVSVGNVMNIMSFIFHFLLFGSISSIRFIYLRSQDVSKDVYTPVSNKKEGMCETHTHTHTWTHQTDCNGGKELNNFYR